MNRRISNFVDELAMASLPNVFNPYADVCTEMDRKFAPRIRKRNLVRALESAVNTGARSVWIAQDLGYRGGRRTGLALTDEAHLSQHARMLGESSFAKATLGPIVAERTAEIIWRALSSIQQPVFLWNVFPLHPHLPQAPFSNRCHNRSERVFGIRFLNELLEILQPETVVAVGGQSAKVLVDLNIKCIHVRHPSYGGQSEFLRSIGNLYSCEIH